MKWSALGRYIAAVTNSRSEDLSAQSGRQSSVASATFGQANTCTRQRNAVLLTRNGKVGTNVPRMQRLLLKHSDSDSRKKSGLDRERLAKTLWSCGPYISAATGSKSGARRTKIYE